MTSDRPVEPIAIVGIGCRLPGGADDPASLWELLLDGFDAIGPIPDDRFDVDALYDPRPATPGRIMSRFGGFLDDIDQFDAEFFNIAPREAERLDPQQRLLLETTWEALEDAGIPRDRIAGTRAGVFVGEWINEFEARLFADPDVIDFHMTTGSGRYAASGRVSYFLDLLGPSVTIDTACSSSLVAVHLACQSLAAGECELAFAGGANVILEPSITIAYSQSRMMAPDGRCKFGDASGDGYVRSEGAAMIALKRLSAALADGDRIRAVIRGSSVTNDGRSSGHLATPGQSGQEHMLRSAYARAGVDPLTVQYVEAHGTGTAAGDPVELGAIGAVLGAGRPEGEPCYVGSVKTNVGHTEGAAGVAGLIKVALALEHGEIPPSLHLHEPNPNVQWDDLRLRVCTERRRWTTGEAPPRAGVSSFGIAGTNAHVVLESAPPAARPRAEVRGEPYLLPISARSNEALRALAASYVELLAGSVHVEELCAAAALRRTHHEHRLAAVGRDADELREVVESYLAGDEHRGLAAARSQPDSSSGLVFVCPGQGSQWVGMGRQLFEREAVFRAAIEACEAAFAPYVEWSLREVIATGSSAGHVLDDIDVVQPTLFAMQVALAELWTSRGVVPDAVVGHSMGEVAAAHIAGVLALDDAARVICLRSSLLRRISGRGAMAVVGLDVDETTKAIAGLADRLSVAVSNSQGSTVISGDPTAIDDVMSALEEREVFCRRVNVDVASHSPQVDELLDELVSGLGDVVAVRGRVPFVSTVTAQFADGRDLGADYWGRNLRRPVQFAGAVERLVDAGHSRFVELAPHPVLLMSIEQTIEEAGGSGAAIASMYRETDEEIAMWAALGALYANGHPVDWRAILGDASAAIPLPRYPWQRERYWVDLPAGDARRSGRPTDPYLGWRVPVADPGVVRVWENDLRQRDLPALYDHRIGRQPSVPASALLEMMLRAGTSVGADEVRDVRFDRLLPLDDDEPTRIQIVVDHATGPAGTVTVFRSDGDRWVRHASAQLARPTPSDDATDDDIAPDGAASERGAELTASDECYRQLSDAGVELGPALRSLAGWRIVDGVAVADVTGHPPVDDEIAALDAAMQTAVLAALGLGAPDLMMPVSAGAVHRRRSPGAPVLCRVVSRAGSPDDESWQVDVVTYDGDGRAIAEIEGLQLERVGGSVGGPDDCCYDVEWHVDERSVAADGERAWLIVDDRSDDGALLAEHLRSLGASAVVVARDGVGPALDELPAPSDVDVVYLAGLHAAEQPADAAELMDALEEACAPLLDIVRGLRGTDRRARITVVTRGVQRAVELDDAAAIAHSALWGLGRAIGEELPERWRCLIDLDAAEGVEDGVRRLAAELIAGVGVASASPDGETSIDREIALRDDRRLVPRLVRSQFDPDTPLLLRHDATYLVTGGFGSLGTTVATWLARHGARRIILLGRTELPPRSRWNELAPDSPEGRRVEVVRRLEQEGTAVHVASVDVVDADALRDYLRRFASEGWPPVRGVFHTAAVFGGQLVDQLDRDALREQLLPKIAGAWTLADELEQLDHFVLFSSIAALVPVAGQAAYAAGNAFLDSFADSRAVQGAPVLGVNWGSWKGTTEAMDGTGGTDGTRPGLKGTANLNVTAPGTHALRPDQALDCLERLLVDGRPRSFVAPIDWAAFGQARSARPLGLAATMVQEAEERSVDAAPAETRLAARLAECAPHDRATVVEDGLRTVLGRILKMPESRIGDTDVFGSLGLDSLMAIELRKQLEMETGVGFSATVAWNYPTIRELATLVLEKLSLDTESDDVPDAAEAEAFGLDVTSDVPDDVAALSDEAALSVLLGEQDR